MRDNTYTIQEAEEKVKQGPSPAPGPVSACLAQTELWSLPTYIVRHAPGAPSAERHSEKKTEQKHPDKRQEKITT